MLFLVSAVAHLAYLNLCRQWIKVIAPPDHCSISYRTIIASTSPDHSNAMTKPPAVLQAQNNFMFQKTKVKISKVGPGKSCSYTKREACESAEDAIAPLLPSVQKSLGLYNSSENTGLENVVSENVLWSNVSKVTSLRIATSGCSTKR